MLNDINTLLRQCIKIIKSFDHPITRDEIQMYGLDNYIRNLRITMYNTSTDVLFDFGRYTHDKKFNHIGIIKVSSEILWYIYFGGNIRFKTNLTEEEIFQQSTINNYYDLEPDIAKNISELISLLEHLWK
ncbi:hypothetical protein [Yersinia phage fHe-Yen9-04]|uniref:Uncharacterized protein n=1 Tax=Yersinia phage fHe-Yen9-04 TaxID=2052742 RepID=A0A2C9CXJ0_9CAUD|nr:hypothetical protein FDJ41_gp446 [Yersinia phage fHe-Yen9-04]SOK58734.1 hypothetical protein [Yersinia phage fHe-Yen9-04]VUE36503.1 hypothetical protein [Yersinia phage fHe-Yen9-04]